MTAYQFSPNVSMRHRTFNRLERDAKLASIAETQVRTAPTPHAANRAHFAMSTPNGDTLLSTPSTKLDTEGPSIQRSASEPKRQANRCTTLLGKHVVVGPIQAKVIKVKPGF